MYKKPILIDPQYAYSHNHKDDALLKSLKAITFIML